MIDLNKPGIYSLEFVYSGRPRSVAIGKQGELRLQAGTYLYSGSAFGPGGLGGRLKHHLHRASPLRWHVDYLKQHCKLVRISVAHHDRESEHAWVRHQIGLPGAGIPLPGFGSSDCPQCPAHLVFINRPLSERELAYSSDVRCFAATAVTKALARERPSFL
ncbi:MAG: GIY-YIG nuclease family protein [Gammaproteobacteria bacterium]